MAITYDKIATTTLAVGATTINLTSIPATYTDLRLVIVQTNGAGNYVQLQYNGDTGSNYSTTYLGGNGATATSGRVTSSTSVRTSLNAYSSTTVPCFTTADIFSYAGSTYKTCLTTESWDLNGTGENSYNASLWQSTAAITSILIKQNGGGNFDIGATATLYGILKA